jgi:predicted nuclease of predicted toxin-antitoxin system
MKAELIDLAAREQRILITEDKDFGLVYVSAVETAGVILIRFPGQGRQQLAQAICTMVRELSNKLQSAFVVIEPGYIRISQLTR